MFIRHPVTTTILLAKEVDHMNAFKALGAAADIIAIGEVAYRV